MRRRSETTRRRVLASLAALSVPTAGFAQSAPTQSKVGLTPAQMREDLTFLRTQWAPLDKSFSDEQRAAFDRAVATAIGNTDATSIPDFALDIMQAVAIPRNGHTAALVGRILHDLPIRIWWFADELRIISVHPAFAELLGARIDNFGSLTPQEALVRVGPYISGTGQRRRYLSAVFLSSPFVLRRIGATQDASSIALTLSLRDGERRVVDLGEAPEPDPGDRHDPFLSGYSVLIPDDAAMPGRWLHVLDAVKDRPLTYAPQVDLSMAWIGAGNAILYIRSNVILGIGATPLDQKLLFGVIQGQVVVKKPRFVVVDLRLNNGGNFFNTALFAQALPQLVPANGRIFVLVSRSTFSAALVTAAMLKGNGAGKVVLVGETMGDDSGFWAEGDKLSLPHSGITVTYARRFEDWGKGCVDIDRCYWPAVTFGVKDISLEPDMPVTPSFAEYAAGRDPVLEAVISMAR